MPGARSARSAAAFVEGLPDVQRRAASLSLRVAAEAASNAAVDRTTATYNLDADVVREFVQIRQISEGDDSATVTLQVRAIHIEAFAPEIRMRRFRYTDKLGRVVDRLLPSVYVARLRGRQARFLRPAFPLRQRTDGPLNAGERIRRRAGESRSRLTKLRYFSFPKKFLRDDLLPAATAAAGDGFAVEFRALFRRLSSRGRRELRNTRL